MNYFIPIFGWKDKFLLILAYFCLFPFILKKGLMRTLLLSNQIHNKYCIQFFTENKMHTPNDY